MGNIAFKAYAITNEIDLNKIAIRCGSPKKYTWEEPLGLQGDVLSLILGHPVNGEQKVFLFSFGSVVFINLMQEDIKKLLQYLKESKPEIDLKNFDTYSDDYELRIDRQVELHLTDTHVIVPHGESYYLELVSTVIAKSVALEKSEEQLGKILDKLESMIDRLENGRMSIGDRELGRTISRILRHEYNTIAYIMILDKPDITWVNSEAGEFYEKMSEFFELSDRYEILKNKTTILNHIIDGFSTISHAKRGLFVEWIIIVLIFIEGLLMVVELFK